MHRLTNNGDVAGGQLAVFQGASERPYTSFGKRSDPFGPTPRAARWSLRLHSCIRGLSGTTRSGEPIGVERFCD